MAMPAWNLLAMYGKVAVSRTLSAQNAVRTQVSNGVKDNLLEAVTLTVVAMLIPIIP